jgi:small subunit ribosomal protein S13
MIFIYRKRLDINIKVYKALNSFYGIGLSKMKLFLIKLGVTYNATLFNLKRFRTTHLSSLLNIIRAQLTDQIKNAEIRVHFVRLIIGSYKGIKLYNNLPLNGQRTKSNAKTAKRFGKSSTTIPGLAKLKLATYLNKKKNA